MNQLIMSSSSLQNFEQKMDLENFQSYFAKKEFMNFKFYIFAHDKDLHNLDPK